MTWGRVRVVLGGVLVIAGFGTASGLSDARFPLEGSRALMWNGSFLIPIVVGSTLVWSGRRLSILYLLSVVLVLGGLAVALWGPEWAWCVPDQPGEFCTSEAYRLPGIWLAATVAIGLVLGLAAFLAGRGIGRSASS